MSVAVLLAGCGGTDAKYVKNSSLGVYLKLPGSWTVFDLDQRGPGLINLGGTIERLEWSVGFDGAHPGSRANLELAAPTAPTGSVSVLPATGLKLGHTLSALTTAATSGLTDSSGNSTPAEVISTEQVEFASGHWGVQATVKFDIGDSTQIEANRVVLFNRSGSLLYIVAVQCDVECFDSNKSVIDSVIGSLTLEEIA